MPTARELLEQADALMRRNRQEAERAVRGPGIVPGPPSRERAAPPAGIEPGPRSISPAIVPAAAPKKCRRSSMLIWFRPISRM